MRTQKLAPVHPGEVLSEEFLKPMKLSQNRLALAIGVPPRRINEIVLGKRGITADTALRLARYFSMSPQFWMGLQMDYALDVAADELADRLEREVRPASGDGIKGIARHAISVWVLAGDYSAPAKLHTCKAVRWKSHALSSSVRKSSTWSRNISKADPYPTPFITPGKLVPHISRCGPNAS